MNKLKAEIADEVEEEKEEFQYKYDIQMGEYETILAKYKQQLKAKVLYLQNTLSAL